jgi:glycosyltransferase involved in cell wall biosynthesis
VHHEALTFSVVVTFHNQREFVADALNSILAGKRSDVEIIAVDDASSDGTPETLFAYRDAVKLVLLEKNQGVSGARNSGAAEATGEYLLFLDGDDAFHPWAFDVYDAIVRSRRPVTIFGSLQWFAGDLPDIKDHPHEASLVEYPNYFGKDRSLGAWAGGTAIATEHFWRVGGWDPAFPVCEDYDLMWRLGLSGPVIFTLDPPTVLHRTHEKQSTQQTARLLNNVGKLVNRERAGRYPGRGMQALERKACVGGCVLFWAITLRRRSRRQTASLLLKSWSLIIAAVAIRLRARVRGRRPVETLGLDVPQEPLHSAG